MRLCPFWFVAMEARNHVLKTEPVHWHRKDRSRSCSQPADSKAEIILVNGRSPAKHLDSKNRKLRVGQLSRSGTARLSCLGLRSLEWLIPVLVNLSDVVTPVKD